PSTTQFKIALLSRINLLGNSLTICSFGICKLNGIKTSLRQIPSSVPRMIGLWLVDTHNLNLGLNSNSLPYRNLAVTLSPPVNCLISPSSYLKPSFGSDDVTILEFGIC